MTIKLDTRNRSLTLPAASHSDLKPACRLIVLCPASETDNPGLSSRIWEIASSSNLNVLILSLCNDPDEEPQVRRKLVTVAAIVNDARVSTEIMIEPGTDWVGQVKKILRPGDALACYAGQKVGFMRKALDQVLRSSLEAPIYMLSDYQPFKSPYSSFLSQVSFWTGALALIGGFLWVEVKIIQMPQDWAHSSLIYVCVVAEVVLIWLWNSLFA